MILHALAIQIRAELRVRLSLNAASSRLTPLAFGKLARGFFCDDVHRKLFIHTFLHIIFGIFRPLRSDATRAAGRSASERRWCACFSRRRARRARAVVAAPSFLALLLEKQCLFCGVEEASSSSRIPRPEPCFNWFKREATVCVVLPFRSWAASRPTCVFVSAA